LARGNLVFRVFDVPAGSWSQTPSYVRRILGIPERVACRLTEAACT
jgi:hypothetical protein